MDKPDTVKEPLQSLANIDAVDDVTKGKMYVRNFWISFLMVLFLEQLNNLPSSLINIYKHILEKIYCIYFISNNKIKMPFSVFT